MKFKLYVMTIVMISCVVVASGVEAAPRVIDFELEIEMKNEEEFELEYEVKDDISEAKYQVPGKATLYGQEALPQVKKLIDQLELSPSVNQVVLMNQILSVLQIEQNHIDEFELDVKFADGKKVKINR